MSPSFLLLARTSICLLLAGTAGACMRDGAGEASADLESSVQPRDTVARAGVVARPTSVSNISMHRPPLVTLPAEAGPAGATRTRDYPDGLRQDVALAGARVPLVSNGITVLARRVAIETLDERVPLAKPTEGTIRSEIGAAMPHIAMQVVDRERSNDYGPYGLALGRVGPDTRCLFMWQWIDGNRLPRDTGLAGPVSVRVRLCRTGTTFDAMAGWTDHLGVGLAPTEVAGAVEAPLADTPAPTMGRPHPSRRRFARRRHDDLTTVGRRQPQSGATEQAFAAPDRPRYLAGDADRSAPLREAAIVPTPLPPATRFRGDLPPEAFAGPRPSAVSPQPRS